MAKLTKTHILKSFSELLKDNELDKITVTMLVNQCNISRQTFYYHFTDIQELISWGIKQSTANCLESVKNTHDIRIATQIYFDYIEENRFFLTKCLSSSFFGYTAGLLKASIIEYISYFVNKNPSLIQEDSEILDYMIEFLSNAVTGRIISSIYLNEKIDLKEGHERMIEIIISKLIRK